MMKYYNNDDGSRDESMLWCYEGVVLPGGMMIVGRWWSPHTVNVLTGPFLFWRVDAPPVVEEVVKVDSEEKVGEEKVGGENEGTDISVGDGGEVTGFDSDDDEGNDNDNDNDDNDGDDEDEVQNYDDNDNDDNDNDDDNDDDETKTGDKRKAEVLEWNYKVRC